MSTQADNPAAASRPFDAERDGMVNGEGAGAFFLETSEHAAARGTKPMARILGYASRFEPCRDKKSPEGVALRRAITAALENAGIGPRDVGHVNANGMSTTYDDRMEALTIRETLGDVPVTAPKSFFGNLGAATGTVEMAASVLAIREGLVPATLNYATADPQCPVNVIADGPAQIEKPIALAVNHTSFGHAVAVVLAGI